MARVTAVLLGYDHLPGTTRYPVLRVVPADHADGHATRSRLARARCSISAGVETVSLDVKGSSDSLPDTMNPLFGDARARTATAAEGAPEGCTTRGKTACCPTPTSPWG